MAVLVEAFSVLVRRDAIAARFDGGWDAFCDLVPNATLCFDAYLARVGFMDGEDLECFVRDLERHGLVAPPDDGAVDVAIVDQDDGPMYPTPWLQVAKLPWGDTGGRVTVGQLYEGPHYGQITFREGEFFVVTPPTWTFEGSLSQERGLVPRDPNENGLQFLRREDNVDVYLDPATGKEVYVGRTDGG